MASLFSCYSQTFQDFWIELVLCFVDASFESIKGITFKAWHTDLFDNLTGINTRIHPVNSHTRLVNTCIPSILNAMSTWKFRKISRVDIYDTTFISCQQGWANDFHITRQANQINLVFIQEFDDSFFISRFIVKFLELKGMASHTKILGTF